ncbi:MAG: response regulator [Bacteroidia bacterium]|nr:response regulator [Bacteroidia bacterium]
MTKKILIADDEVHIRNLLEQTLEELEDEGVELHFASNGKDALAAIQEEKPQLVLLDFNMPHMSGVEVCQTVKKELHLDDIYIILLTGKGQEADRQQGLEAGANRYLTKPFDPTEVSTLAEEILGI